jgi:hypothetical protein
MVEIIITFTAVGKGDYVLNIENLAEYVEAEGQVGKTALVHALEMITNHVKHGPHMMEAAKQIQ